MKKALCCLILLCLCAASLFAVKNVGDYTLDEVKDPVCASYIRYLKDNDFMDDYSMYGIYYDGETWTLNLTEPDYPYDIVLDFYEDYISFSRRLDINAESRSTNTILKAVNSRNLDYLNWAAFCYAPESGRFYAGYCLTNYGLSNKTLYDAVDWFSYISIRGTETISEDLGL